MHDIRKQLQANIKKQQELANISNAEVRRQIIIKKAISRRSKKEDSLIRQQKLQASREEFKKLGREKLAKHMILSQERDSLQQMRYKRYIEDLEKEKSLWLDEKSVASKLTGEFFSKPSSTGYKTSSTKFWRYQVKSLSLRHFMDQDLDNFGTGTSLLEKVANNNNNSSLDRRVALYETLDKMVATGKDREDLERLMEDYVHEDASSSTQMPKSLSDLGLSSDDLTAEEMEMLKENIKQEFGISIENLDSDIAEMTRSSMQAQESSSAAEDADDKEDLEEMIRVLNTKDANDTVASDMDTDGTAAEGGASAKPKAKAKTADKKVAKKAPAKGKAGAK